MSSENFLKAGEIFDSALAIPPENRNAYLNEACDGDDILLQEVQSLLTAHQQAKGFLQTPAFQDVDLIPEDHQLSEGEQIGAYKIVRQLGSGGMGAVYLAERADKQFKKFVAIKLVKRGMDTEYILRYFQNERQILANFDHPNIARLLDGGSTESGLPYFVMEYVEGKPIDQYCDEKQLNITERLGLLQQVCAAVAYAHRNLVVHRDIKPTNILVTSEGTPKLLDFGIAKILQSELGEKSTATCVRFMTPEYASPEQATGLPVTTLSDVYSLGVLMYEVLTGHFPYSVKKQSALEILRTITETQPPLPSEIVDPESVSKMREGSHDRLRRRLRGDLDNIILMALRKEPQRRYQSVDQLAEDIQRHNQGLPITARKDTIAYRTARFVLRNRITVSISALAILTIAVLGLMMQWRANKQAKLFQEFGQEVTRNEASMRYAYLLPLHNIQQDKKHVTDRLNFIKKQMEVMGSVSYGPGYYSLGRGYLSLHRYQDAYDNLILAWQKYGYQEPAAANALGLTLAMLYQEKLREAEQLYNKEQLSKRKLELEKRYRAPAQQFIEKGANASESPEYINALLDFLGKQYTDALTKSRAAEQNISWHYESKKLQGDILAAMGNDQSSVGKTADASELYEKAKAAYLEAARKGESDPQIYEALCSVQASIQRMQIEQKGKSPEEDFKEGGTYCKKALQADPDDINANLLASRIYRDWGYHQYEHGIDPSDNLKKSADFARTAIRIDTKNPLAHLALGNALNTRADWELIRGRDAIEYLATAEKSLTTALEKMPEDHELLSMIANNSWKRAKLLYSIGKDYKPPLEKCIHLMKKAIQLSPQNSKYLAMLGAMLHTKGTSENDRGFDGSKSLEEAVLISKQSFAINPNYLAPYIWCALSYIGLAELKIDRGEDPTGELDNAISIYRHSIATDPEQAYGHAGIGIAYWRKGDTLQKNGKDPTSDLQNSREAFKKALKIDNQTVYTQAIYAEVDLVAARYAISKGERPEIFFQESERIAQTCLAVNPDSAECLETLAANYLLRAEYQIGLGRPADREISTAIKYVDHSLSGNPKNALTRAYRGKLFLLRAQAASGISKKQDALEAEQSFEQAFQIRKTLRREYGKFLDTAEQLAHQNHSPLL